MGDRTWVEVTVRRDCLAKFLEMTDRDMNEDPGKGPWEVLFYEEVNYGGSEGHNAAAAAGCVFYGCHGSGGEYGAYDFWSDGSGVLHEWETGHKGDYVFHVNKNADLSRQSLDALQAFVRGFMALHRAAAAQEDEPCTP